MRIGILKHFSRLIWMYLFEIFFVIGLTLSDESNAENSDVEAVSVFRCQFMDGLYDRQSSINKTAYDCWGSHLTDKSRYKMFDELNKLRALIANGTCPFCIKKSLPKYRSVFLMNYHWILEYIASSIEVDENQVLYLDVAKERDNVFNEIRSFPYDKGTLPNFEEYMYVLKHDVTTTPEESNPSTVVDVFLGMFWNPSTDGFYDESGKGEIFSFWFPTTTYFGCNLRYNESSVKAGLGLIRSSLICAFATKGDETEREPKPGPLTYKSCRKASLKGDLKEIDGLPICVDINYEENNDADWPCQFYYPVPRETFGASKKCEGPNHNPDFNSVVYPESFQCVQVRTKDNDSIFIPNKPQVARCYDLCKTGFSEVEFYTIPRYILNCYSPITIFLTCSIFFGAILLILITSYINRSQ